MAETENFGIEEGLLPWLPPHFLDDDACFSRKDQFEYRRHQPEVRHNFRSPSAAADDSLHHLKSRFNARPQRTKYHNPNIMGFGGPGMQAVFLDSGQRSGGTGVFLPRRAGITDSQLSNKPAPVLLPSRVIQALNLNVHEIGLQFNKPRQENSSKQNNNNVEYYKYHKNRKKSYGSTQYCSPEIFLPKEWTY